MMRAVTFLHRRGLSIRSLPIVWVCLLPSVAPTAELPFARAYHQVSDICINEVLLNPDVNAALLKMSRPLVSFCDCVARMAMRHFSDQEYPMVLRGELPASALPNWRRSRELCLGVGMGG
jgi:hypothetical protein